MKSKLKVHLWTLPRWFATSLFAAPAIMGGLLSGGMTVKSWLGVIATVFIMAGGHSFNSFLDYSWTGLDKGETNDRSAEKDYAGGQSVIAAGIVSPREVAFNAVSWYIFALIPVIYLTIHVGWPILLIAVIGMLGTFAYSKSKFNYTHELVLGTVGGPVPLLAGMFATTVSPPWVTGLVVSVPFFILPSFIGLALDEWPDAEANIKKGVRSIAYKVWENNISLEWYLSVWFLFMYMFQVFLISIGMLAPLSAISLITWPFVMSFFVLMKKDFRKWAGIIVLTGVMYPVLLVLGQYFG